MPSMRTWIAALPYVLAALACGKGEPSALETAEAVAPVASVPKVADAPAAVSANPAALEASAPAASGGAPPVLDGPRIYSKRRHVWIHYQASTSSGWAGFLGLGSSVRLRGTEPRVGDGCAAFYPIEPRGWVCLNERTTLDPADPEYVAVLYFAPKLDGQYPHHYGESRGTPRYRTIPTREEQHHREAGLDEHLANLEKLRAGTMSPEDAPPGLHGVDPKPANAGPPDELFRIGRVQEERDYIKSLSTIAWSHEFDAEGRTWLVTADVMLVPKDRVSPYPTTDFKGVELRGDVKLPIVFVRYAPKIKYRRTSDGGVESTGEFWPRLSHVGLTGETVSAGGKTYLVTKDEDRLIDEADATVLKSSLATPWGEIVDGVAEDEARKAAVQRVPAPEGGRRTWVEVSVLSGWLIAYEGTKPVYATLIAPGRGGVPRRGIDPLKDAATPTGTFRIDGKFSTATMANPAFVHSDVPYAQNFHGPHALHMAYWHDGWGERKSAGCINRSPADARWFFHWTEPLIPEGWVGIRSDKEAGPATTVIVHN